MDFFNFVSTKSFNKKYEHIYNQTINDDCYNFFERMIDLNKISEYEKKIYNLKIKIISFDNNDKDDIILKKLWPGSTTNIYPQYFYLLPLLELETRFKKYGYSLLSNKILLEEEQTNYFGCAVEFNYDKKCLDIQWYKCKNDVFICSYLIPREIGNLNSITFPEKKYNYKIKIGSKEYKINANCENTISFDEPIPIGLYEKTFLKIIINKNYFIMEEWIKPIFKIKGLYYDNNLYNISCNIEKNRHIKNI